MFKDSQNLKIFSLKNVVERIIINYEYYFAYFMISYLEISS